MAHRNRPIRFGVMCGTAAGIQAWEAATLWALLELDDVRPALLIVTDGLPAARPLLARCLVRLGEPRVARTVPLPAPLASAPVVRCRLRRGEDTSYHADERDVQTIQAHHLDFILQFGTAPLGGSVLSAATHGVWSFRHGDGQQPYSDPPYFREIYRGDTIIGAALQRLGEQPGTGVVLRSGCRRTRLHSYRQSLSRMLDALARWPAQVCIDIRNDTAGYLRASPTTVPASAPPPRAHEVLTFGAKLAWNQMREVWTRLCLHDQWQVGVVDAPIDAYLAPGPKPRAHWLGAWPHGYVADPFGVVRDGRLVILCEDFVYGDNQGRIASVAGRKDAERRAPVAIGGSAHLSYPYLIEDGGRLYCIPETHETREVGLYQSETFPHRWRKVATLLHGIAAVDSTVFRHDGLWWLACTDGDRGANDTLLLFYASRLEGPWQPHQNNPVKTDVRSARPAGTPFQSAGSLYRPSQDCSRTYGGGITINRIRRLSPVEFDEEPAAIVEPDADDVLVDGVHTLSAASPTLTLIDGKRRQFVWRAFRPALTHALANRLPFRRPGHRLGGTRVAAAGAPDHRPRPTMPAGAPAGLAQTLPDRDTTQCA